MAHGDTQNLVSFFHLVQRHKKLLSETSDIRNQNQNTHLCMKILYLNTFISNDIHENNCKYLFSASFGHNRQQNGPLLSSFSTGSAHPQEVLIHRKCSSTGSAESSAHRPTAWSTMATTLLHTTSQQVTPTPPEKHEKRFPQQPHYNDTSTFETQLNVQRQYGIYNMENIN